jgi:predicted RNase H-like HicB family nuclease
MQDVSRAIRVEVEHEHDGRWLAKVPALSGALPYGQSREEAIAKMEALALRILAERLDHGEPSPWPATKARRVLAALLGIGWRIRRQWDSHRTLGQWLARLRLRVPSPRGNRAPNARPHRAPHGAPAEGL